MQFSDNSAEKIEVTTNHDQRNSQIANQMQSPLSALFWVIAWYACVASVSEISYLEVLSCALLISNRVFSKTCTRSNCSLLVLICYKLREKKHGIACTIKYHPMQWTVTATMDPPQLRGTLHDKYTTNNVRAKQGGHCMRFDIVCSFKF